MQKIFFSSDRQRKTILVPVNHIDAASCPRFRVSFFAQQFDAVIRRHFTDTAVPGQGASGRQAASVRTDPVQDFLPQGFIQCQVGRFSISHLV